LITGDAQPSTDHGVLIRNFGTGDSVHWWHADGPAAGETTYAYRIAGDGRFVTFGGPGAPAHLVDRPSDAALSWNTEDLQFVAASSDARVLLATTSAEDGVCLFWALDLSAGVPEPLLRFGVPGARFCDGLSAVFGPPGSETLLLSANNIEPPGATVHAVDLAAGSVESIADAGSYQRLASEEAVALWFDAIGDPKEPPLGLTVTRYDSTSGATSTAQFGATAEGAPIGPVLPAPNERLIAWQESLRLGGDLGLGGWFEWPIVVVADIDTGEVLLRVVRGALDTGTGVTGWLADSSGLVITVEGQFALLGLGDLADGSGATVTPLPFAHDDHFDPAPDPSPADPTLFAYDGRFVDLDGNDVLPPMQLEWGRSTPLGDWTSGGAEYYVATADLGAGDFGDGPLAPIGLAPQLRLPPFDNEVHLVVTEATELRAVAQTSAAPTWELEPCTAVVVQNDGSQECLFNFGCATLLDRDFDDPRPWWIFVRTEDGRAGWAQASSLDWAG
jgi:hypothetical protein